MQHRAGLLTSYIDWNGDILSEVRNVLIMNLLCCVFHQICDGNEYIVQLRLLHGSSFSKDKLGGCQNSKANQHQREREMWMPATPVSF
jgi:hypothetical protein